MPLNDENKTDSFDREETVLGDSLDPSNKAGVTSERRLMVENELARGTGQTDTYGRLRTVLPIELISYYFSNTDHTLKMNTTLAGGSTGTVALSLPLGAVAITNTTGDGHKINFSTKKYIRHTPGQTHRLTCAARLGDPKTNVEKRWGAFTEFNGFFFKQTTSGLSAVVRRGGAGDPVVEATVMQADFNIDKLDGTGKSGLTLDPDNHGIFIIEWDWHGAGVVRFGVKFDERVVYCHKFVFDFVQQTTSIRSAALPLNVEIKNVGAVTGNTTMTLSAMSAYKDGEKEIPAVYAFSASNGVSSRTVQNSAYLPVLSIRPKLNFKGILARIGLVGDRFEVLSGSNNLHIQVVLNGTLTSPTWVSVNDESNAERDVSATAITGGVVIWEGYVTASSALLSPDTPGGTGGALGIWELNVNYQGTVADTLSITCRSLGNNNTTYATIRWVEFQ